MLRAVKESRSPHWPDAVEAFRKANFQYGETIPQQWFWDAFELERPHVLTPKGKADELAFHYWNEIHNLRMAILNEDRIWLDTIDGIGYRVTPPTEQTSGAVEALRKELNKAFRKASSVLENVRQDELNDEERARNHDARARLASLKAQAREKFPRKF